jgi:hypothetical protein
MQVLFDKIQEIAAIDINNILSEIFADTELQNEILDKVRYDQLKDEGVNEENKIIGYYSPYTELINPDKQANTHYTFLDTGAFYDSMRIYVTNTCIVIDADGEKTDFKTGETVDILQVYGDKGGGNMLGLTEKNMNWLVDKLTILIIDKYFEKANSIL